MRLFNRLARTGYFALIFAGAASAQFRGAIQGSVLDPAQSVVPGVDIGIGDADVAGGVGVDGVDITLRNEATSQERRSASSPEGFYRFSELAPGTYSLVAKKSGFADLTVNHIHVAAESVTGADLHLQTAQVSSSITVSGETTGALETERANIQRSLTSTEILRSQKSAAIRMNCCALLPEFSATARATASRSRKPSAPATCRYSKVRIRFP